MGAYDRVTKSAGRKILRRATKGIPFIGAAVAVGLLAHTIRKKGTVNGVLDSALDAVPFVGLFKFGVELFTGDWFPDRPDASPVPSPPPPAPLARREPA
jgi:hypothetical protein